MKNTTTKTLLTLGYFSLDHKMIANNNLISASPLELLVLNVNAF
jgi:hypothetical protein